MSMLVECPQCKRAVTVPDKLLGGMARCPDCSDHFLVLPGAIVRTSKAGPNPAPASPATTEETTETSKSSSKKHKQPVRKRAKFITARTAKSKFELAADGKLPELVLEEIAEEDVSDAKTAGSNPVLLVVVLMMSLGMSLLMVLMDSEPAQKVGGRKEEARVLLEKFYIGNTQSLEPYQLDLRGARRAHAEEDYRKERVLYLRVLNRLHSEGVDVDNPLTEQSKRDRVLQGTEDERPSDEWLQELLGILLGN